MKRLTIIVFAIILLGAQSFTDVSSDEWYYDSIEKLYSLNIISGYEDKSYRPDQTISIEEFVALVCKVKAYEINTGDGYWSEAYIERAQIEMLVIDDEFRDFTKPITRGQMARILLRAIDDEQVGYIYHANQISDLTLYDTYWQNIALRIYHTGIMRGYPDQSIALDSFSNRAEAAVMILKFYEIEKASDQ